MHDRMDAVGSDMVDTYVEFFIVLFPLFMKI